MAADFPRSLENGDNCLYDTFSNDKNRIFSVSNNPHVHDDNRSPQLLRRHQLACIDGLAHHLTALSLLRRQTQNPPKPLAQFPHHYLEGFNLPVRTFPVQPLLRDGFDVSGGRQLGLRLHEQGIRSFSSARPKPGYCLQAMNQDPDQLESYLKERANRVLRRRLQNHLLQQNRPVLPFKVSTSGFKGGFLRESGGTGVFHPRIDITGITSTASVGKRQSVSKKQEIQVSQQRNTAKRATPSQQEDSRYDLPPDMGLPKDWTY